MTSEDHILGHLRGCLDELTTFLVDLATMESPSSDPASQAPVFERVGGALECLGMQVRRPGSGRGGGQLCARPRDRGRGGPVQLLVGHVDTVWPHGTLESMPVVVEDGVLRGPGTYDMKAGVTQIVFALRALRETGHVPEVAPVVFLNSDEEIGSRESTDRLRRLARVANRAFVLEPSLEPGGRLKTTRKGIGRFTVTVKGRAAHAGLDPGGGASAILELSHQIQRLFALNDPDAGVSVNVGLIDGGLGVNVIAPESRAQVDVRVPTTADAERITAAILGLTPVNPEVRLEVSGGIGRPPMEPTPRNRLLWESARSLGERIGVALEEGAAGGGSDGNTTSQFTATLDGLGAVGDGAHASHEHVRLEALVERTALLALLLLSPPLPGAGTG